MIVKTLIGAGVVKSLGLFSLFINEGGTSQLWRAITIHFKQETMLVFIFITERKTGQLSTIDLLEIVITSDGDK